MPAFQADTYSNVLFEGLAVKKYARITGQGLPGGDNNLTPRKLCNKLYNVACACTRSCKCDTGYGVSKRRLSKKVETPLRKGRFVEEGGILSYHPPFPDDVVAVVSTRGGGNSGGHYDSLNLGTKTDDDTSNVIVNRTIFLESLSVPENRLAIPEQTHSDSILQVSKPGTYPNCDGLVTDTPNLFLTLSVADCCPVFAFDPERMAVGLAHAGWRGTRDGISPKLVEELVTGFGSRPSEMMFALGPSIGPCCYKVGEDLRREFDHSLFRQSGLEHYLDLWEANRRQLVSAGVEPASIFLSRVCTSCGPELFFSHRRDLGRTGRMMALIGMRE